MADEASTGSDDSNSGAPNDGGDVGRAKGAAPEWVVAMAIEEADGWIDEEIRAGSSFALTNDDIAYMAIRLGGVSGLQSVPTSDEAQAKALEMFRLAAARDPVGAAIAWAVATDVPLPAKALEEAGVTGLPRSLTDHQRQSRHDPTRQLLYGNEPAVSYSSPVALDAMDAMRDAFLANAGRMGASLRVDAETQERAREQALEQAEIAASWPAGLALDPETLGTLADTIGRTQGLVGFETSDDTRDAGLEAVEADEREVAADDGQRQVPAIQGRCVGAKVQGARCRVWISE